MKRLSLLVMYPAMLGSEASPPAALASRTNSSSIWSRPRIRSVSFMRTATLVYSMRKASRLGIAGGCGASRPIRSPIMLRKWASKTGPPATFMS